MLLALRGQQMEKKASLRSKQVKIVASAGMRLRRDMGWAPLDGGFL
jgi:hypothetical protein